MRIFLKRMSLDLFVFTVLVLVVPVAHANTCSPENVAGDYGFTLTGTVVTPAGNLSVAAIGRATVEASAFGMRGAARTMPGGSMPGGTCCAKLEL